VATTDSASDRVDANGSPTAPPTSGTVGVVVEGVRKQYGDCEALKGVSMEMECGEITALLGMFLFLFLLKNRCFGLVISPVSFILFSLLFTSGHNGAGKT
jgi:hypothetical protein